MTVDLLSGAAYLAQGPRLLGLSVVKNEQDIIEPFVRHNLRFLNSLVVIDNGSVDNTKEILGQLAKEFGSLAVRHEDEFGHTQSERMTRLLRKAQLTYRPHYVIPLDADEFIGVADRSSFCTVIGQIPPGGYGLMPWRTYVLAPDTVNISEHWCPAKF